MVVMTSVQLISAVACLLMLNEAMLINKNQAKMVMDYDLVNGCSDQYT